MKFRTKVAGVLAAVGVAAGALVSVSSGASAASAPCAGYTYQGKVAVNVPPAGSPKKTVGYVYWYQKSYAHAASRVCAVTRPTSTYLGKTSWLEVRVETNGNGLPDKDAGNYHYYAGPVYIARVGGIGVSGRIDIKGGNHYTTLFYI
ncbi:hypothetical protein [Actinoallomurus acaciae]|uniref:Uncharacterized protein n=1 Tax=Actinoallomurus acaciae TaxID=502577 RepID=A0ABV5Y7R0_9ACTN